MKHLTYALLTGLTLAFAGCKKDNDNTAAPSGPREREVEYRITAPGSGAVASVLIYRNETGAFTTLSNVALPATYKFKRTLQAGDNLALGASLANSNNNSELTGVILLDGQQIKSETGRGSGAQLNIVHIMQ